MSTTSPRDRCAQKITLQRDDVITVGKTRWQVENARGIGVNVRRRKRSRR